MHILAIVTGDEEAPGRHSELYLLVADSTEDLWVDLWNALNINLYLKKGRDFRESIRQRFIKSVQDGMEHIGGDVSYSNSVITFEYFERHKTKRFLEHTHCSCIDDNA